MKLKETPQLFVFPICSAIYKHTIQIKG